MTVTCNDTVYKLGELFCGPGGIGLGAKLSKIETDNGCSYSIEHAFANDIDSSACATYEHNLSNGNGLKVICGDIKRFDLETLPQIDALTFGFPCNDFSIVGEHKGFEGEYGGLYSYGKRILDLQNPKWFLAENVGGLQSANEGKAFKQILRDLKCAGNGYNVTVHLYKFEEYGIPQARHRIVIVGIDKKYGKTFKVPKPTTPNTEDMVTAKQAIEEPPIPKDAANNELTRQSAKVIERLNHIPEGENAWYPGLPQHLRLNVKGAKLSQIYKRLHSGKPAYTITGSGGGGTHGYHWTEPRALTNRERARLQSFPDEYVFCGKKEEVRKQIGMAVPPMAAKILIEAVMKTMAGIDYPSVDSKWSAEDAS